MDSGAFIYADVISFASLGGIDSRGWTRKQSLYLYKISMYNSIVIETSLLRKAVSTNKNKGEVWYGKQICIK